MFKVPCTHHLQWLRSKNEMFLLTDKHTNIDSVCKLCLYGLTLDMGDYNNDYPGCQFLSICLWNCNWTIVVVHSYQFLYVCPSVPHTCLIAKLSQWAVCITEQEYCTRKLCTPEIKIIIPNWTNLLLKLDLMS